MTIDEAISEFKERAEDSKKISELGMESYIPKKKEEKQLAEWLEELKSYRASVFSGDMTQKMLKEEYNKAVDDFYNKIIEAYKEMKNIPQVEKSTVHTIALGIMEQLKNKNLAR